MRSGQNNNNQPANAGRQVDRDGLQQLQRHEGARMQYYNDAAGNCTYGVGTLAHHGHCTEEELQREVTQEQVETALRDRVADAERAVRRAVPDQPLTQEQFNGLAGFVYNVGATRARHVLRTVNRGELDRAADQMQNYIRATLRDADGRPVRDENGIVQMRVLPGLVRRRQDESAPLRTEQPTQQTNNRRP